MNPILIGLVCYSSTATFHSCNSCSQLVVDAAASRLAHFRGFEVARCGLTERMLTLFLNALTTHENTLESLDLCGNPGRIHSPSLNNTMSYFPFLRKLNLSRLLRASGEDALLTAETLLRWRLEELDLRFVKQYGVVGSSRRWNPHARPTAFSKKS